MTRRHIFGNRKVAIIGAGYAGSSIAYALALRDVAREIVLIDINYKKTDGEARIFVMGFRRWVQRIYMPESIRIALTVT